MVKSVESIRNIERLKEAFDAIMQEVGKFVVGQQDVVRQFIVAILCDANALVEGYPGLAKTLMVKTLAQTMDLKFSRIQNTPDLMPSDITGTYVIEETSGKKSFKFQPGPLFANIILADEINRATPKTQSALLEAMQEKQVTVGNNTFLLEKPFFVLATQNPIEQEGSLALSELVFLDGKFIKGSTLLKKAESENLEVIESEGKFLYKLNDSYTLAMNYEGKLVRSPCWLYTLPYVGQLIKVQTEDDRYTTVTANHPFVINENGFFLWKKAGELKLNDKLVCPAISKLQSEITSVNIQQEQASNQSTVLLHYQKEMYKDIVSKKIISLKKKEFSGTVFGLVVPELQNYIAGLGGCGINHNTYPLPEAQVDRFLFKINITYPTYEEEMEIVEKYTKSVSEDKPKVLLSANGIKVLQELVRQVPIAEDIKRKAVSIVTATRMNKTLIQYGASPRASIGLILAAKARAIVDGRKFVSIKDIREMAYPVLRHRIVVNFEAEREGKTPDDIIKAIIDKVG